MPEEIVLNIKTVSILVFIGAFLLTYTIIPKIIGVVEYKKLMDNPNKRSSHFKITPTLGGVAFYCTLIMSFFFLEKWDVNTSISIIPGLTILFIVGLKDDLVVLSPMSKLVAQIIAVAFVLSNESMLISGLNGFMGIDEISSLIAYPMSAFLMITVINAYNLIDGIDGLAAIVGITISLIYGLIFYFTGVYFFSLLCVVIIAILLAFLRFNLSAKRKIFMGDTGSLVIGFLISILTIRFLALTPQRLEELPFYLENVPLIAISILIVPLFDTVRVFAIRLLKKKSPFSPDRNHTHHILIDLGLTHRTASVLIGLFNLVFVALFIILGSTSSNIAMTFFMLVSVLFLVYLFYRMDFSFSNLKRKILFKRKVNSIKENLSSKKGKQTKKVNY